MARTWRSKHYCPPPLGTNRIIPIPIKADDVTGTTDPIPKKRKTPHGNTTASVDSKECDEPASKKTKTVDHDATASVDSKEYDEPASKKTETVDHNATASVDSKEYDEPASKKTKTVDHNVCELSEDLRRELSKLYRVPLQDEDWTSWLEFINHANRASALREVSKALIEQEKKSIGVDHPFVRLIGEFAVSTFNKLREMLVKKGDHNNILDFEIMKCQYLHMKVPRHYFIYMTVEAFEKGKLGVYEVKIVCNTDNGRRTLTKFVLTDRRPVGKKAMAMPPLSRLISIYKSVEGLEKDIETYIQTAQRSKKGEENGNVAAELRRLKKHYKKAIEGLGKVLSRDTQAPARNPTPNRDTSGMVRRTKGTTCKGYDYYNPLREFGLSLLW